MSFSVIGKNANDDDDDDALSLIRIHRHDEEDGFTNDTAEWIQQAEALLTQQWPRGGPYREKLLYPMNKDNSASTSTTSMDDSLSSPSFYALPCSYLLLQTKSSGCIVGHGRLTECFESAGGNAVAATYIVVDKTRRGCGLGSTMMKLLEQEAERLGYHYVYLWTQTAIPFYQKNGYSICERVSLKRACLKSLEPSQVDGLEAMLLRKSQKANTTKGGSITSSSKKVTTTSNVPKETILLPPAEDGDKALEDVWLRKRLVEHVGSILVSVEERIKEIESIIDTEHDNTKKNYSWYYQLSSLPWQSQIGPSCGLAALRMVREYFLASSVDNNNDGEGEPQQLPSLLGEAQEKGYTNDGEVFNATHLADLAETVCGIETELWTTTQLTWKRLADVLSSGGVFILPYDSKPGVYSPVCLSGQRAHYGIIVGILIGTRSDNNGGHKLEQTMNASMLLNDDNNNIPEVVYLIVQHSLSKNLMIAPMNEFWESNQQLLSFNEGKFGVQDLDLKDRIVVCKAIHPDYA